MKRCSTVDCICTGNEATEFPTGNPKTTWLQESFNLCLNFLCFRIGILALGYRDMCIGSPEPNGVSSLSIRLLEKTDYKVLCIPYTEYNPQDKLVQRVKYLDNRLKSLVKGT